MRIALVRALQVGDLLCAVPAMRALRAAWPDAQITLVGLPWARDFARRFRRYVDDLVVCDEATLPEVLAGLRERRFDLAIQMHGSGEIMNGVLARMEARRIAGFYRPGQACPDPARFLAWHDHEHEVMRLLRLAAHLGAPARGTALEFPLQDEDWREWTALGLEPDTYAVVHPGAELASRRWPAERFAQVADALSRDELQVVLTGTASEAPIVDAVRSAMKTPALDLAGLTSLGGLAALVARARLVVANDTGISHIAAATQAASVIVASGSHAGRWAPLERSLHRVLHHDTQCQPCALGVSATRVIQEARDLVECVV